MLDRNEPPFSPPPIRARGGPDFAAFNNFHHPDPNRGDATVTVNGTWPPDFQSVVALPDRQDALSYN